MSASGYDPARVGRYVVLGAHAVFGRPRCREDAPGVGAWHLVDLDARRCAWCGEAFVDAAGGQLFASCPAFAGKDF